MKFHALAYLAWSHVVYFRPSLGKFISALHVASKLKNQGGSGILYFPANKILENWLGGTL
jgi:hypothetical protein